MSTRRERAWASIRARAPSGLVLLVLLEVTAVLQLVNLAGGRRTPAEATIAAQALTQGQNASVPEVGLLVWGPVAAWLQLTGALARHPAPVVAGREAMVVPVLLSVVLLWWFARSLRFSRLAAAVAVVLFALTPPAADLHRTLDGAQLAVPLLLAGCVLALVPGRSRRRLVLAALSAGLVATATLVHPAALVLLPAWAWWIGRGAPRGGRRWRLAAAAVGLAVVAAVAVLLVQVGVRLLVWPELPVPADLPGQLRAAVVSDGSLAPAGVWVLALVLAGLVVLSQPVFRPLAVALLGTGLLALGGDAALLLPVAALVLAAAGQHALSRAGAATSGLRRWSPRVATALAVVALLVLGAQLWPGQLVTLATGDRDLSQAQAQTWLEEQVDREEVVVIDGAIGAGLEQAGFPERSVAWAGAPRGVRSWQALDYVVSTPALQRQAEGRPSVQRALQESVPTAVFGSGPDEVEIRRVVPEGVAVRQQRAEQERAATAAVGAQLVDNPAVRWSPDAEPLLTSGEVDARLLIGVSRIGALGEVEVAGLPRVPGEEFAGAPVRQVLLRSLDGQLLTESPDAVEQIAVRLGEQDARYAPRSLRLGQDGLLVTWGVEAPWGLLGGGDGS